MYNVIEDVLPLLKDKGFEISNPWDIVGAIESIIAPFRKLAVGLWGEDSDDMNFLCDPSQNGCVLLRPQVHQR